MITQDTARWLDHALRLNRRREEVAGKREVSSAPTSNLDQDHLDDRSARLGLSTIGETSVGIDKLEGF